MSRKFSGTICFLYVLALLFGFLALLLPNWASGKFEAVRSVTVVKEIDSGLFKDHSIYYMKDDTIPDESDNPFPDFSEKYIYPEVVKTVKAFMIIGLSFLTFALMHFICRCCCHDEETSGKISTIVYIFISLLTIISGGFIGSCPIIFKNHVIGDFEPENINLGVSWWFAIVSAICTLLVGLLTLIHSFYIYCGVISNSNDHTMSRNKEEKVFTVFP